MGGGGLFYWMLGGSVGAFFLLADGGFLLIVREQGMCLHCIAFSCKKGDYCLMYSLILV